MKLYLFPLICIKYYNKNYNNIDSYLVQTTSQVRSSGTKLPEVHGMKKEFRSKHKNRKTTCKSHKGKLHIGQGGAGLKRKRSDPINQTINPPTELLQKIPGETKLQTGKTNQVHSKDPMHTAHNADEGMTHTRHTRHTDIY